VSGATAGTVLVIDDEADIRQLVDLSLSRIGIDVHTAANLGEARELLAAYAIDACLTDMRLPDGNGVDFVAELARTYPELPIAVITAHGQMGAAVEAMKNGAFDFVSKPVDVTVLRNMALQALRLRHPDPAPTRRDDRSDGTPARGKSDPDHRPPPHEPSDVEDGEIGTALVDGERLIGTSPSMLQLRERIARVARTNAPVWITGESGTGKELVARLIHANGPRADGPFVAINCGAIPAELMESELFGHCKGAFTGAHRDQEGLFRAANEGTLFLDEIAELPLHMQVKLLRVIQERSVRPVGAAEESAVDVRLLSASHSDLATLVESGVFRQDLYYRLNVISVRSPALRDRPTDIPMLATSIMSRMAAGSGPEAPILTDGALNRLRSHDFPGNVRELENILERACAMASGTVIEADDLELESSPPPPSRVSGSRVHDRIEGSTERDAILAALEATRWNRKRSATLLGLTYRQLRYRIKRLDLEDSGDRAA